MEQIDQKMSGSLLQISCDMLVSILYMDARRSRNGLQTTQISDEMVVSCGFQIRGVPQIIQVMNDHDFVLKPSVTWGTPMT